MMNTAPGHLDLKWHSITEPVPYFDENIDWFNRLTWKGKLSVSGNELFNLFFSGSKYDDGMIAAEGETPILLSAQIPGKPEEIILFDGRIHGYSSMLVETIAYSEPGKEKYVDEDGKELFEIFMWTNSSIDFEDEFKMVEGNKIRTLSGALLTVEQLRRDAYDYIGVLIKNNIGRYTRVLEYELA